MNEFMGAGGVEGHATLDGAAYLKAQANVLPAMRLYRETGEVAPAGPRAEFRTAAAGVEPGPVPAPVNDNED